jgi:hypothetical protein
MPDSSTFATMFTKYVESPYSPPQAFGVIAKQFLVSQVPLGRWPRDPRLKEMGLYFQTQSVDAVEPVSMALFTRALNMSPEQAQLMIVGPRQGMRNPDYHLYIKFHFVYGRKPFEGERV